MKHEACLKRNSPEAWSFLNASTGFLQRKSIWNVLDDWLDGQSLCICSEAKKHSPRPFRGYQSIWQFAYLLVAYSRWHQSPPVIHRQAAYPGHFRNIGRPKSHDSVFIQSFNLCEAIPAYILQMYSMLNMTSSDTEGTNLHISMRRLRLETQCL